MALSLLHYSLVMKKIRLQSFLAFFLMGIISITLLGGCSSKVGRDAESKDIIEGTSLEDNGALAGDFLLSAITPDHGKSGDRFTMTGESLNPDTDLILFGEKVVIPVADHSNGRQFLQAAQEEVQDEGQLISLVPSGVCNQDYLVCVVRKELRSNCLKFVVEGDKECSGASANETETPDEDKVTTGKTVAGDKDDGEGEGNFRTQAVAVSVFIKASRNPVYRVLNPETTLEWGVIRGTVDSVSILANDIPVLENAAALSGSMTVTPEVTTEYKIIPYYRGEVQEVENNTVTVNVIGGEDIETLAAFLDIEVSPQFCLREPSNDFTCPEVTVRYVTNKLQGGQVDFSVLANNPNDAPAELFHRSSEDAFGEFTFVPEKSGVLSANMLRDGEEDVPALSGSIAIDVEIAPINKKKFKITSWNDLGRRRDHTLQGWAKVEISLENVSQAVITGHHIRLCQKEAEGAVCEPMGDEVRVSGYNRLSYRHEVPVENYAVDNFVFYAQQDCAANCEITLAVVDGTGEAPDNWTESFEGLRPKAERFEVKINEGDGRKYQTRFLARNARAVRITGCNAQNQVYHGTVNEIDDTPMWTVCSNVRSNNPVILEYQSYYSDVWQGSDRRYVPTEPASFDLIDKRPDIDNDGRYQFEWKTNWVARAVLSVLTPEGRSCYNENLVDNWVVDTDDDNSMKRRGTVERPVDPDCYIFHITVVDLSGHAQTKIVEATPKVQMSYTLDAWNWHAHRLKPSKVKFLGITTDEIDGVCFSPDFRRRMNVVIKNGAGAPWLEGGRDDAGNQFVCPNVPGYPGTASYRSGQRPPIPETSGLDENQRRDGVDRSFLGSVWKPFERENPRQWKSQVVHYYYHNPDRIYGCRLCVNNKSGQPTCTGFDGPWDNGGPIEYQPFCGGKKYRAPLISPSYGKAGPKGGEWSLTKDWTAAETRSIAPEIPNATGAMPSAGSRAQTPATPPPATARASAPVRASAPTSASAAL
jgi:hypothetical protein